MLWMVRAVGTGLLEYVRGISVTRTGPLGAEPMMPPITPPCTPPGTPPATPPTTPAIGAVAITTAACARPWDQSYVIWTTFVVPAASRVKCHCRDRKSTRL